MCIFRRQDLCNFQKGSSNVQLLEGNWIRALPFKKSSRTLYSSCEALQMVLWSQCMLPYGRGYFCLIQCHWRSQPTFYRPSLGLWHLGHGCEMNTLSFETSSDAKWFARILVTLSCYRASHPTSRELQKQHYFSTHDEYRQCNDLTRWRPNLEWMYLVTFWMGAAG